MIIVTHPVDAEKLDAWRQACGERDWPQYYVMPLPLAEQCQSTNHDHATCYGDLWQCSECWKTICCNEGTDGEDSDLCDDCWAEKHEATP